MSNTWSPSGGAVWKAVRPLGGGVSEGGGGGDEAGVFYSMALLSGLQGENFFPHSKAKLKNKPKSSGDISLNLIA